MLLHGYVYMSQFLSQFYHPLTDLLSHLAYESGASVPMDWVLCSDFPQAKLNASLDYDFWCILGIAS